MSENELIATLQARCDLLERERDLIAIERDGYADRMAEMLRVLGRLRSEARKGPVA